MEQFDPKKFDPEGKLRQMAEEFIRELAAQRRAEWENPTEPGDLHISENENGLDVAHWLNHKGKVVHAKVEDAVVCDDCGQVYVVNVN